MQKRRATGALEGEVLAALWAAGRPLTPRETLEAMGADDLAYTTVMTILTRLWQKGVVEREQAGRAYVYAPKVSEADLAAMRMHQQLERAGDRQAALSRFVGSLSRRDERLLRRALGDLER